MEDRLKRLQPRAPRGELRSRILAAASGEAAARSIVDVLWRSRAFWSAAAAVIVVGLVLGRWPASAAAPLPQTTPTAEAVETAKSIAATLGGGDALVSRFARQMSGPAVPASTTENGRSLLEDLTCQG
jgi:hypothetical protein